MSEMNKTERASSMEERRLELQRDFHPDKMKVVRKELFASLRDPAVTIRDGNITFNTACINGLEDVVWVKLMINEGDGILAVQECDENDRDALRWCIAKPDKRKSRKMNCPGFTDLLYSVMNWDKTCRYKILGYRIEYEGDIIYVFDMNVTKIFREKLKDGESLGEVDTKVGFYPDDIAGTFGVSIEEHKKAMEITEENGLVSMAALTGVKREKQKTQSEDYLPEDYHTEEHPDV